MSTMIIDYDYNDDDDYFIDYVLTMLMMVIMSDVTPRIHAAAFGSIVGSGFSPMPLQSLLRIALLSHIALQTR